LVNIKNVLAFFAHPDDETMLSGGILALLRRAGADVHYLCATRGEGGERGEPPLCTLEELGELREQEMICAVHALHGSSLTFLDYEDPRVGPEEELFAYSNDLASLAEKVAEVIQRLHPFAVITHGVNGEYGHPAHVLSHQAAMLAVAGREGDKPALYSVSPSFPQHPRPRLANKDEPAHLVLDITPVLEEKTTAAMCHRTQHALFVRRSSKEAGRQVSVSEVIMRYEGLHRVLPVYSEESADKLFDLLAPWRFSGAEGEKV
jgi:LmbE family N-acetylglucosaminyl deacetylase